MNCDILLLPIVLERRMCDSHVPTHNAYLRQLELRSMTDQDLLRGASAAEVRTVSGYNSLLFADVNTGKLRTWRVAGSDRERFVIEAG